jgi:heme/copper-type cytochrome/quinol oxidase subunit 2
MDAKSVEVINKIMQKLEAGGGKFVKIHMEDAKISSTYSMYLWLFVSLFLCCVTFVFIISYLMYHKRNYKNPPSEYSDTCQSFVIIIGFLVFLIFCAGVCSFGSYIATKTYRSTGLNNFIKSFK